MEAQTFWDIAFFAVGYLTCYLSKSYRELENWRRHKKKAMTKAEASLADVAVRKFEDTEKPQRPDRWS